MTIRTRRWITALPNIEENKIEQPIIPENKPGQAMIWPGTLNTQWWVQWVDIKQAPKDYVDPVQQMELYNKKRKEIKQWKLIARYDDFSIKWWEVETFIDKLSTTEQDYLNEALEKRNQSVNTWPQLLPYQEETNFSKWYKKQQEQTAISESDEPLYKEIGTWIWKGFTWLAEWLSWMWEAIKTWLINPEDYDPDEVRNARKKSFIWPEHDIERSTEFDVSDLWTQRFWIDTLGSQVPYVWYWIWGSLATWAVTKSLWTTLKLSPKTIWYFELWGNVIWQVTSTAIVNWWDTYNSMIEQGATPEEASQWAKEVFLRNYATVLTDLPQWALTFWKWKFKLPKWTQSAWVILTEWWEELYEEWIQADVTSKILQWEWVKFSDFATSPSWQESFIWWLVGWGVFTAGWNLYNSFQKEANNKSDSLIDYASRWDDSFLDRVDYSMAKWEIWADLWNSYKEMYVWAKEQLKQKAEPIVDKIAEKTWAKTKLLWWEWAKLAPTKGLEEAKQLEWKISSDALWKKTGWEKGTDWQWRFEIDDKEMSYVWTDNTQKLDKVIDHPRLFEQYPQLKNVTVEVINWLDSKGSFNIDDWIIQLNKNLTPEKRLQTLAHEIQHWIQTVEWFAGGWQTVDNQATIMELIKGYNKIDRAIEKGNHWPEKTAELKEMNARTKETIEKLKKENVTREEYNKLAWEVEARNATLRLSLSSEYKKDTAPSKTEDTPRAKQTVKRLTRWLVINRNSRRIRQLKAELQQVKQLEWDNYEQIELLENKIEELKNVQKEENPLPDLESKESKKLLWTDKKRVSKEEDVPRKRTRRWETMEWVTKEDLAEVEKKYKFCVWWNCWLKSIQEWKKYWKKGKIISWMFYANPKNLTREKALQQARQWEAYKQAKKKGVPIHTWHELNGKITDDIYNIKDGYYFKESELTKNVKKDPKVKQKEKLQANKIDELRGVNELKKEDKEYYDNVEKWIDTKYKLIKELLADDIIYETKRDDTLIYYSLTEKGEQISRGWPKEIAHYKISDFEAFEKWVKPKKIKVPTAKKIRETKRIKMIANEIKQLIKSKKQPTEAQIAKLLEKYELENIQNATNWANQKNMIDKEWADFLIKALKTKVPAVPKAPVWRLNENQRNSILDMLWFASIFKRASEIKVNINQVSKSLNNIWAKLHIVNTPEWQRVKIPFTLMWNKASTYKNILLPMIKKWIDQGANTFVEAFWWAWTSYYFAEEMFNYWLKEMHVNHFDNEKYQVIKAIKEWKDINVEKEVAESFNTIIEDISAELQYIPEVQQIMKDYDVKVWTKAFKEMSEIFFYPQYAPEFFEQRPDTKLWIKGELSSTFKEWLREKLEKESEWQLKWEKLDTAVEEVLWDPSLFENQYPQISKKISTIIDKYEGLTLKDWDFKTAMLVSTAKHFRQRGDSWQKVVSATWGFQNVLNIRDKMTAWLTKYQQVFNKFWDKIKIYNQDWKEFITDMGKQFNNPETMFYWDPPYVRTTGTYIKQNPELTSSLNEYADTDLIDNIFSPMKDSLMMFTNDIDWKYFEALDKMLDGRMSKDIIWYREWTTPTSLVTTTELSVQPKDVNLSYYQIIKDKYIKDIYTSLKENLFPKISKQQEKTLAKFEQHFMRAMNEKFWELNKIQWEIFKWKEAFEKLETSLDIVVSGQDKQNILREAKKWLKQNKVTGAEVVKLIDKINRLWVNKQNKIKETKKEIERLRKITTIDVESKKMFFDWFNDKYTTTNVAEKRLKEVEIIDKIMKWEDFTAEEYTVFEQYLEDEAFYNKIETARKESIYNMTLDDITTLLDTVKYYEKVWKDYRIHKTQKFDNEIETERIKAEPGIKKIESTKPLSVSETIQKDTRLKEIWIKAKVKTKEALLDATPMEWVLDEELNLSRMVYNFIEKPINQHRDTMEDISIKFDELTKELKITSEGWKKITIHWLARRSDWKGLVKIIARMKKAWEDVETYSDKLQEFASEDFLTDKEQKMYDYMQTVFKDLWQQMQETKILVDNEMVEMMDEYFPIQMDWASNQDKFAGTIDPNTIDNWKDLYRKTKTEQWFTKKATALEVVPELDASKIFKTHVSNVSYYNNMQAPIKQLNQITNQFWKEKLWDLWYKFMKEYLDVLSRQWILWIQSWFDRMVSAWVRNFQSAVLGFNPTTMALQTSAILEWLAVWWNIDPKAYLDIVKAVTWNKETWNMIVEKSWVVRNREYRNLFWNTSDKFDKWIMEKWNKYWFYGIQKADAVLSRVLWLSEYKRSLKQWKSEVDSIYNADTIVKKAMWHTHFEWKAMFVLKNERKASSVATVFQNFVLNHSAMLRYWGWKKMQEKYWKAMGYALAFMYAGLLFALYEELIRKGWRIIHKQKEYWGTTEKTIAQLISFIPYISIIYWTARYDSLNVVSGWKNMMDWIEWNKDWMDFAKIFKWIWTIMWVWGTAEFDRIYKWYLKESKSDTKIKRTSKRTRRTTSTKKKRTRRKD